MRLKATIAASILVLLVVPGLLHAQAGLFRARQIITVNETLPGGAATDLMTTAAAGTVITQQGPNVSGHGNLVVNSSFGPGFAAVALVGNESATMIQLNEAVAGGVRGQLGILSDSGDLVLYNAANQTVHLDGVTGKISLGTASVTTGSFALSNSGTAFNVTVAPGATSANYTLTLPLAAPAGTQCLQMAATGAVTTTGVACGGSGAPGGINRDVQINDAGVFGVTAPPSRVHVLSGTESGILEIQSQNNSAVPSGFHVFHHSDTQPSVGGRLMTTSARGTIFVPLALMFGDTLFNMQFGGYKGNQFDLDAARILVSAAGNWSATSTPTELSFQGTPSGSTVLVKTWVINPDGDWLPQTDGARDIATSAIRVGSGFFDTANAEVVAVSNAAHSANRSFTMDAPGNLLFRSSAPATVMELSNWGTLTLYGGLLVDAGADSTLDIATSATRFRWGFADIWNAEELEITNSVHSAHWTIRQDVSSNLEVVNGGEEVVWEWGDAHNTYRSILPGTAATYDLGTGDFPFNQIWGTFFALDGPHATESIALIYEDTGGAVMRLMNDDTVGTPEIVVQMGADPVSSDGFVHIFTNAEDQVFAAGQVGGYGFITLWDSSDAGNATIKAADNWGVTGLAIIGSGMWPNTAYTSDLGSSGLPWDQVFANFFEVRSAAGTCTILNGSGAPGVGACRTCDMALRTDGGAGTTLYVCEAAAWVAK